MSHREIENRVEHRTREDRPSVAFELFDHGRSVGLLFSNGSLTDRRRFAFPIRQGQAITRDLIENLEKFLGYCREHAE